MRRYPSLLALIVSTALGFALTPRSVQALTAQDLGVIVNEADPLSVRIGDYYAHARHIPAQNIIRIRIKSPGSTLQTLIESYWKSVAMPGQGIFIGEPLAILSR